MSWPGDPAATTSRLSGSAMCQGSRPDSAAGRLGGAALSWDGESAVGALARPLAAPAWLAASLLGPPYERVASQAATATTTTASVAAMARLRRTVAAT